MTHRVILTGSRHWTRSIVIRAVLGDLQQEFGHDLLLIHGACPTGADALADLIGVEFGITQQRVPAAWDHCAPSCPTRLHRKPRRPGDIHHPGRLPDYCPGAGPRRNAAMAEAGAAEFIAFATDRSWGTASMIRFARENGIPGRKWTPDRATPVVLPATGMRGAA